MRQVKRAVWHGFGLVLLGAAPAAAQAPAAATAFVQRLGRDTVAVDRSWRSGNHVEGRCLTRVPQALAHDYAITLAPDGRVQRLEYAVGPAGDSLASRRVTMEFGADTVAVTRTRGDSVLPLRIAASGALPALDACWTFLELTTRRLAASGAAELAQPRLGLGADAPDTLPLTRAGDSVTIALIPASPYVAAVDSAGRILGARRVGDWRVTRAAALDLDAIAAAWAAAPMGSLSPTDSLSATVGAATVQVKYSRPATRGRAIFGGIVPWNEVWRTGANAATLFETSADLTVGGTAVPAGSYSLWTIPAPGGWTLILNRNTGQWGTDYDAQYDFARIPMRVEALPAPVERVTITVEPRAGQPGGTLAVAWDRTRAVVPIAPR